MKKPSLEASLLVAAVVLLLSTLAMQKDDASEDVASSWKPPEELSRHGSGKTGGMPGDAPKKKLMLKEIQDDKW